MRQLLDMSTESGREKRKNESNRISKTGRQIGLKTRQTD